ncbi:MAG TPA: ribose-5-phosphate isomerase RpiA [Candidatus Thermoplasmatota archaeon]|nr:ribose-5-phosphate isomerase RpiA [Candidatus Thermoplasmatota archaeon]
MDREELKREAGRAAAELVEDGMVVGLGTGSTVRHTLEALGGRVRGGLRIVGIPTSKASEALARALRIPLSTLDEHPRVDLTIDGADEVDPQLRLIKGGGGAHTREKVVARASRRMVVVADAGKLVERLGSTFALPIEVLPFAKTPAKAFVEGLGASVTLRLRDGQPFTTDNGNVILDARWDGIDGPEALEARLETFPGVVACGLFLGLCHAAYVAGEDGVRVLAR